jgi:predicted RNA-binding protein with PIN domain
MVLVDGYNLLHAMGRGMERDRLLGLLEAFCRDGGRRALVVFDPTGGMRRRETRGGLEIRVVAQGRTADEELLSLIGSTDDRTRYTLVSNDREITSAAARKHMQVVSCETFAAALAASSAGPGEPAKEGEVPPGDVDYWLKEFGIEE